MFAELRRKISGVSPRAAVAGLLIALVAGSGLALLFLRGGEKANADDTVQPMAARINRVDGSVGIARVVDENTEPDWTEATLNGPVTVGDRIYARDGSRASIALTGHNFVRMDPGTALDVLELGDNRTQFGLRSGLALFDVGALESDDFYEVGTPYGAVDFTQPGLYQVGIDNGSAIISVLSGLAQVVGRGGSGYINKGQVFTLVSAAAAEVVASRLSPNLAGGIVDDYYRYRNPRVYDGRYASYDTYLQDPFYYDPYRNSVSCQYVGADIPGLYDLDGYGDWSNIDGYGNCWAPRVSAGWAPFRTGSWDLYDAWGPTWVSQEPWGWAPYHYGRWTYVQERWFWVPVEVRSQRSYCPANVAFIPFTQTNQIGWVPLAPGEAYVPRYYDANLRPRYLASSEIIREAESRRTFVNLNSPSAVTVVPVQAFRRRIDPSVIAQMDPQLIARSRPTLDPFADKSVRDVAIKGKEERRGMRLARAEQDAFNTPVVTSRSPAPLPGETNFAKTLRVEPVAGEAKKNKLKVDDTNQVIADRRPNGLPQADAPNQIRVGKDRNQRGGGEPAATNPQGAQPQAQQESLRQRMKDQLRAERQQQPPQQQTREQRREQKRLERNRGEAAIQQQQQQQQRVQQQQQQRVQQQQQRVQQQQQQRVQQQQQQQRKQERRKPPEAFVQQQQQQRVLQQQQQRGQQQQQQQRVQQQQQMQNQQRKQEKRRPPEAFVQQQQRMNQASQIREQARAQQDAFRQQAQARQQQQQQMMRQQASQAQAVPRQEMRRQEQKPQRLLGPPNPGQAQPQQRGEKAGKRKPPQ